MKFSELMTPGGFKNGEVRSALQKTIRRGDERQALFWATELDLAGYGAYVFRTLRLISSEDVGLGEPGIATEIATLQKNFLDVRTEEKKNRPGGFPPDNSGGMTFLVHAVLLLVRARKSRIVDNACAVFYVGDRAAMQMEIPDYALDAHTERGRAMGRTEASTYEESYRLENVELDDPYLPEVMRMPDERPKNDNAKSTDRRRLLAALHVRYRTYPRAKALEVASKQFDRKITSSAELTVAEARWLLRTITKLDQKEAAKAAKRKGN